MRFFITILIALGLCVLVLVLIVKGFSNHPSTILPQPLTTYASTATTVQFVISGPITADQNHNSVTMNVGQIEALINVEQGYQGQIVGSKSYTNNQTAFLNFLSGLEYAGFTDGSSNTETNADLGVCPFGDHYNLQIINGSGQTIQNYWTDSCSTGDGTFKGQLSTVEQLFTNQIPDYDSLTNGINI